jgi:hypothetical protein
MNSDQALILWEYWGAGNRELQEMREQAEPGSFNARDSAGKSPQAHGTCVLNTRLVQAVYVTSPGAFSP